MTALEARCQLLTNTINRENHRYDLRCFFGLISIFMWWTNVNQVHALSSIPGITIRIYTCLFANIRSTASRNSSSANILINSSRASPIRSLSLLSTTNIKPCKYNNKLIRCWIYTREPVFRTTLFPKLKFFGKHITRIGNIIKKEPFSIS